MPTTEVLTPPASSMRLPQIDVLRGAAVILVLLRHHWAGSDLLQQIGWVGVDLFFVLSGFLVSGLLFAERKRFGNVRPFYFLARRGFKIYPMLYASLAATLVIAFTVGFAGFDEMHADGVTVVSEIFFLQNYVGTYWGHHWSLAVEEHFYLLVALLAMFRPTDKRMTALSAIIFLGCLLLRYSGLAGPFETHGRIDSLFIGVVIAYLYHFHDLKALRDKHKPVLMALAGLPLAVAIGYPFEILPAWGFTAIHVGFGALLVLTIYADAGEGWLPWAIGGIGVHSYGIYLFHMYLIRFVVGEKYLYWGIYSFGWGAATSFLIYFVGSIALGVAMSFAIERPFLALRDRLFPRRASSTESPKTDPI